MTLDETKKVIAVIISAYPNYHPADIKAVVSVWKELLEEHSYECVSTALRMYMSTDSNGFAPSPGQIIERVKLLTSERRLNEIEAWTLVRKAIQNSGYNSVEEYAKLTGGSSESRSGSRSSLEYGHLMNITMKAW